MYKIKELKYQVGNKTILKNVSINIKTNNFLSILGTNGCGKSTLIKLINKNVYFFDGSIQLDDKDILNISDKELANKRAVLNQSINFEFNFKAI
jgi:iron complex transport system ATP-binding protein